MGDNNNQNVNNTNLQQGDQNTNQPQYKQPAQQQPGQQQPGYQQPGHQQPGQQQPGQQQPGYNQSTYQQPGQQSGYQQQMPQNQPHYNMQQWNQQPQFQYQPQYPLHQQPKKSSGLAIASMVCGIVSLCLNCCYLYISVPGSLVGLILGIISIKKGEAGRGMAITGIVTSAIAILLMISIVVGIVACNSDIQEFFDGLSNIG